MRGDLYRSWLKNLGPDSHHAKNPMPRIVIQSILWLIIFGFQANWYFHSTEDFFTWLFLITTFLSGFYAAMWISIWFSKNDHDRQQKEKANETKQI